MSVWTNLDKFFRRKSVKYSIPFFLVVFGGAFALRQFAQLRYQFSKVSQVSREEMKKYGIEMKKPGEVTLESEYEKVKNLDIDNWEQIRGPRPWEEQEQQN